MLKRGGIVGKLSEIRIKYRHNGTMSSILAGPPTGLELLAEHKRDLVIPEEEMRKKLYVDSIKGNGKVAEVIFELPGGGFYPMKPREYLRRRCPNRIVLGPRPIVNSY